MPSNVITIAQQKGGAGKTTLTLHLATTLHKQGHKVICLDIDPQESLSQWYRRRLQRKSEDLISPEVKTVSGWRVTSEISRYKNDYDYILIDTPPNLDTETRIAIRNADIVLTPVQPSPLDLWSTEAVLKLCERERTLCKLVLNRVRHSNINDVIREQLRSMRGSIANTTIGSRVAFALSVMYGLGIAETVPNSLAAEEMTDLVKETKKLIKGQAAAVA